MKTRLTGFSLTELLIVLVIIGILLSISAPMLSNFGNTARNAEAVNNIHVLEVFLSNYYIENGTYVGGTYNATGSKTLQSGPLGWQPGEDDALQQFSYQVGVGIDPSSTCVDIARCYDIVATGLGRDVPTTQRVIKLSDGQIVFQGP